MSVIVDFPARVLLPRVLNGFEIDAAARAKVLIVDDSRLVRSVFSNALAGDYECLTAVSSVEAIEYLMREHLDLVLLDTNMPGIDLLRMVIDQYPDTDLIMMSSNDGPELDLDALHPRAIDHLTKPCELAALQLSVERAFQRRKLQLANSRVFQNGNLILLSTLPKGHVAA